MPSILKTNKWYLKIEIYTFSKRENWQDEEDQRIGKIEIMSTSFLSLKSHSQRKNIIKQLKKFRIENIIAKSVAKWKLSKTINQIVGSRLQGLLQMWSYVA